VEGFPIKNWHGTRKRHFDAGFQATVLMASEDLLYVREWERREYSR